MPIISRISSAIFDGVMRKNASFLTAVFAGAFAFEIGFEGVTNSMWDNWNKGRQWKDIKQRYMTAAEDEDDE